MGARTVSEAGDVDQQRMQRFFIDTASDEIKSIYRWARARYAAPWAVLAAVLLRVIANVEPYVQLPGVIGGRGSLNLFVAFVGYSGAGKGTSDTVGALAYPASVGTFPIGSGEGVAALFARPDKEDENNERITRAILNVPEVDKLAGLFSRQGTILSAELKSLAMGEQIGQQNARKDTTRIVAAHSYRCCMSVGVQPEHSRCLFDDTSGGTPQRFWWVPVIDPHMPREAPTCPGRRRRRPNRSTPRCRLHNGESRRARPTSWR